MKENVEALSLVPLQEMNDSNSYWTINVHSSIVRNIHFYVNRFYKQFLKQSKSI